MTNPAAARRRSRTMYVVECAGLYIKAGGFTYELSEAKRYRTIADARKDCVYPWTIKKAN